jgi:hypothetical protein
MLLQRRARCQWLADTLRTLSVSVPTRGPYASAAISVSQSVITDRRPALRFGESGLSDDYVGKASFWPLTASGLRRDRACAATRHRRGRDAGRAERLVPAGEIEVAHD